MLRCNIAGLIPLMASDKYKDRTDDFYQQHRPAFDDIARHKSFYLLRRLPEQVAYRLLSPALPGMLAKRKTDGLWSKSERITFDILSAIRHADAGEIAKAPDGPLATTLHDNRSFYALLIKKDILGVLADTDLAAMDGILSKEKKAQREDGSWEDTVVGTVAHMEALLDLGLQPDDEVIRRGVGFLFTNLNENLPGIHTKDMYGLVGHSIFTTPDRNAEFEAAQRLKPEWIPRSVCFRTLAILPNAVCLSLLLRLGLEGDERVSRALDSVYDLFAAYGGLCASNIKKPFL